MKYCLCRIIEEDDDFALRIISMFKPIVNESELLKLYLDLDPVIESNF